MSLPISDPEKAKKNYELATSFKDKPSDKGSFYHGTKADLQVGDLLTAGGSSNYKPELKKLITFISQPWLMGRDLLLH